MAEKKAKKPTGHKGGGGDTILWIIIIAVIILYFGYAAYSGDIQFFLKKTNEFSRDRLHLETVGNVLVIIMFIFSTFFLFLICYCAVRLLEIRKREHEHLHHEIKEYAHHQAEKERKLKNGQSSSRNEMWNNILRHLLSSNQGDWKLAILEADELLDHLLGQLGFKGESLGEKLKTVDRVKFPNLNGAWEVHLVRNRIAHEGSLFELGEYEAKRLIAIYEQIFRDFNYI
jgi:flagellar basal body-associated protein FliL